MKLRVGLVGLGSAWESRHRPALRALQDRLEVKAVCEPVAHRAEQAAIEFQASVVDGYRALARRSDVDAILLLSEDLYGSLPILAACDAGKAIYCATSINLNAEQARQIKQRVDSAGIAFVAEFPRRHTPATLRLKELIATRLGEPRLLFAHSRLLADASPHNGDIPRPAMRDLIELVDWCRYVVNAEPTSVTGIAHTTLGRASRDYQMMSLDFSPPGQAGAGAVAQISCGQYIPAPWQEAVAFRPPAALQVACEHGIAFVDLPNTVIWFDNAGRHLESLENDRPVGEQSLLAFYRSVTSLVRNTTGLEDAYRSLTVVTSAEQSHREGRRIELESS
jgi:predicted dehydrogenase